MDNRLVLCILFLTLSCGFMGTSAQVNNTTPGAGVTVVLTNSSTTPGADITSPNNMTTPGADITSPNNMTTPGADITSPNNMTTSGANGSSPIMTTTTIPAPPLMPNFTVVALDTPINRTGCGSQQLCAAHPAECDPSSSGSQCFFLAAKQQSGQNFEFELSGESNGYIAATLSPDATLGGNDTTYVCANNNGTVLFFGALLDNNKLRKINVSANSVKGRVDGKKIQCTFSATVPSSSQRAAAPSLSVSISTGEFNATTQVLGDPDPVLKTSVIDLANPNTNVTNEITPNTTTPTPTTAAPSTEIPVASLETSISKNGCGSSKLCAAEPKECGPSTGSECFFISTKQRNGQMYDFELSGQSDGYIAAGVSTTTNENGNHQIYICANDNNTVKFFTGEIKNLQLSVTPLSASNVQGSVNSKKIQCIFTAELTDTTRAAGYSLSVSTGTYTPSTGRLGTPSFKVLTNVVNLADPNANITNLITANSTNSTNTAYPVTHQQTLMMPALLVTVIMLAFTMQ